MQVMITGRHFEVTDPIKGYIEERIARLEPYAYNVLKTHVILSVEKFRHFAEVTLWTKHHNITGKSQTNDVYTSIDAAVDKAERQLIQYHEKKQERRRRIPEVAKKKRQ